MKVKLLDLQNTAGWEKAGVRLPRYDIAEMRKKTQEAPVWVHFGAGNIFRAFIAALQQNSIRFHLQSPAFLAEFGFPSES